MGLTERKREFLDALRRLYHKQDGPVHYEEVAREVGVSKWTAYDMLRSLAEDGLVEVEYTLNRQANTHARIPGRSIVVFRPDDGLDETGTVPPRQRRGMRLGEELNDIKKSLGASLAELGASASQGIWQGFTEKLDRATGPAAFCGYMAVLLVACARILGGNSLSALARLVETGADAHSALVVLSGAIMGMLVAHPSLSHETTGKMAGYMRRFQYHVDSMSGRERGLLLEFVRDIAGRA